MTSDDPDRTKVALLDPLVGTVVARRYRLEIHIAAGGFGAIYRALDLETGRDVAIKLLHQKLTNDRAAVARFRREGEALAQLRDPHTVTAYDVGETAEGALYIAMELLQGESLYSTYKQLGPLPWRRVCAIARAVCGSLAEAHALGIVHRDLKPANIHLEERGDERDYVKVLDFGIAKIIHGGPLESSDLTHAGQMIGTFDYMPPEQMVGGECTGQSDIFTLGIVMYEMIGGMRPFGNALTAASMLAMLLTKIPEPLSAATDAPPELDRILERCLARKPEDRFADVADLAAALDHLLGTDDAHRVPRHHHDRHGNPPTDKMDIADAVEPPSTAHAIPNRRGSTRRRRPGRRRRRRSCRRPRCPASQRRRSGASVTVAGLNDKTSQSIFERAKQLIPGGVNSPVRACRSVGADPVFVAQGDGAFITDVDGNRYIDLIGSWGPLILGHSHPEILDAIKDTMASGTTFGAPTEIEVRFAETLRDAYPSMEMVRAVSSGTEATMSALRLARGYTGRDKLIKTDGGYHGHADCLLVAAGSGAATLGIPGSAGVPDGAARDTIVVPYNDLASVERALAAGDVAAVILQPLAGNMGLVIPAAGYLDGLRAACTKHGTLLIFDEVMTGFRVAYGGAQQKYGITPDLTCLGKIIGGGLPAAAFGGRAGIMEKLAPLGPVYQAGTLSGNPVAMAAGLKAIEILARPGTYAQLELLGQRLGDGLAAAPPPRRSRTCVNRVGSMLTLFFCAGPVTDYATAKSADTARFGKFFRGMRDRGVFLPPSQFEAMFVSLAHTDEDIDQVIAAAKVSLGAD